MEVTLTARSIGLIVASALAAGWIGASALQEPAPAQARTAGSARRPLGASIAVPRADRLKERAPMAPMPNLGRNPFVYGTRAPRPAASYERAVAPAPAAPIIPVVPTEPPPPAIRLSGIAANVENGAAVLTAIINDSGSLVFAKVGDRLSNGYAVVKIDEAAVTLADAAGATLVIRLP